MTLHDDDGDDGDGDGDDDDADDGDDDDAVLGVFWVAAESAQLELGNILFTRSWDVKPSFVVGPARSSWVRPAVWSWGNSSWVK